MYKYIISLTTIPSRINYIEKTLDSLIKQTIKPEKIVLNIPKSYTLRFNHLLDKTNVKKIFKKYIGKIVINYIESDYGPGTKLLGLLKSNMINYGENDTYVVLVDDDLVYKPYMLEYFNNYNRKPDNEILVASFFRYQFNNVLIGQGADGFFIKSELLHDFNNYYDIIKNYDYINYHDDFYISYFFYLKTIHIEYIIPPYNTLIYSMNHISASSNALVDIQDKYSRVNLQKQIYDIMSKLKDSKIFNDIQYTIM